MQEAHICSTCQWGWDFGDDDYEIGTCHRHAPKAYSVDRMKADGAEPLWAEWPGVLATDGCGEWTSRFV